MKRLFYALLVAGTLVTIASSCHKKPPTVTPPPAGSLLIYSNVIIVDSTQWILHSVPSSNVLYYTFTPTTPNISVNVGDIIVGITNGGYLSRVTNVSINGAYLILQTTPATLNEVFKSGTFNFQIPLNDPNGGTGISRDFTNYVFYNNFGYSIKMNADFNLQGTINVTFIFDSLGQTNFQMSTTNATLNDTVAIAIKGQEPYNWSKDTTFSNVTINTVQLIPIYGGLSVPIAMTFYVHLTCNGIGGAANYSGPHANTTASWISNNIFTAGLKYSNGMWQPFNGLNATNVAGLSDSAVNSDINSRFTFNAQIVSAFFNVNGPQINVGFSGDVTGKDRYLPGYINRTDLWSTLSDIQVQVPAGFSAVGTNLGTFNQSWTADSVFYQTPYELFLISGNNQTGAVLGNLPNPMVVQVNDSRGNPVSGITVTFNVTHGGATFNNVGGPSTITVITGSNGQASVNPYLGPVQGTGAQVITATVVDGNLVPINGAPVTFNETAQ